MPSKLPWQAYLSELIGTAVLIGIGLSVVILDFGVGSPVATWLPDTGLRRLLTGFLFGTTGALIAVSPVGKVSGAHINPIVTLAFHLKGKLSLTDTIGYILGQFIGAFVGSVPLLFWGPMGQSVNFGVTVPGDGCSLGVALGGEILTTMGLVMGLFLFLGRRKIRQFTPLLFPFLYAVMVYLEAPISGTSTNPARSFGPAVIAHVWQGWWIYVVGPLAGMLFSLGLLRTRGLRLFQVEVAKIYHFGLDWHGIFRVRCRR